MQRIINKTLSLLLAGILTLMPVTSLVKEAEASSGRDCDGNAIMYCGALSVSELKNKIEENNQLEKYYNTLGIKTSQFNKLKEGRVYKNGNVFIGNDRVASDVYSSGRHFIPGSTRDNRFSYPIYWRHPSVSFNSESIPAFVYLNNDDSFAYAIIKSCGNPVTKDFNAHVKYKVTVNKFADNNQNKKRDSGEKMLDDFTFTIKGSGLKTQYEKTNKNGEVVFENIPNGTYEVTESYNPDYWKPTTGNGTQKVIVNDGNEEMWFGNKWVKVEVQQTKSLVINKFNDLNADGKKQTNEPMLSGRTFRITGSGVDDTGKTNAKGQLTFSGLKKGDYTVTETIPAGWVSTTTNPLKVTINTTDEAAWFGNRIPVYNVVVNKFNDLNENGKKESAEPMIGGRVFRIQGNGIDRTATTLTNGQIVFSGLRNGNYTITETIPANWKATTANPVNVVIKDTNANVFFGNAIVKVEPTYNVVVDKFEDADQNGQKEVSENLLSGWEFTLSGNGVNTKVRTNSSGRATFNGLKNGTYTLTETVKPGWTPTSQNPLQIEVKDSDANVIFGNAKIPAIKAGSPVAPTPENPSAPLVASEVAKPTTLPVTGAKETLAALSIMLCLYALYSYRRSRLALLKSIKTY